MSPLWSGEWGEAVRVYPHVSLGGVAFIHQRNIPFPPLAGCRRRGMASDGSIHSLALITAIIIDYIDDFQKNVNGQIQPSPWLVPLLIAG